MLRFPCDYLKVAERRVTHLDIRNFDHIVIQFRNASFMGSYRDDSAYLSRIEIRQNASYPNTISDLKATGGRESAGDGIIDLSGGRPRDQNPAVREQGSLEVLATGYSIFRPSEFICCCKACLRFCA